MALGRKFPPRPTHLDPRLDAWMRAVEENIREIPSFSISSTTNGPNSSGVTGDPGTLLVDVASSATTRLWIKDSASTSTTGWSAFSWI